ncbi:MAG: T9SS type A sorting domain-containing protein [FCB group bacterium]|jgi:photosystem II stability/assembly factor-like uncharacterized protein
MKKFLLLILFFLACIISLNAQWERCQNGTPYCEASSIIADSNYIYAGFDCGVWRSSDNGDSWIQKNKGFTNIDSLGGTITALAVNGKNIFAGTFYGSIFLSTNNGDTWALKNKKYVDSLIWGPKNINTITVNGNDVFFGTNQGVFLTTDNYDNWIPKNNGLPYDTINSVIWINTIAIKGQNIFAGMNYKGIYLSTDYGDTWIPKNNGLTNLDVYALAIKGNNIYAGTWFGGIFLSTDNGDSWKCIALKDSVVDVIYIKENNIFISSSWGLNLSTDDGINWTSLNSGLSCLSTNSIIINGDYIFIIDIYCGVLRAKLNDLIIDVKETNQNNESIIYPNPAYSSVSVKYESSSYSKLQISIFDLPGNEVLNTSEDCNIGLNEKIIDCHCLETGYYIVRLKQGERVEAKPLLIVRN